MNSTMELFDFAKVGKDEDFIKKLVFLANNLAEEEVWDFRKSDNVGILKTYIFKTFSRCYEQDKVLYSEDNEHCAINTGLLSRNGSKEIMMLFDRNVYQDDFNKNSYYQQDWYFAGFKTTADRDYMEIFKSEVPAMATYTDNVEAYFFNPNIPIEVDVEHIVDDNWARLGNAVNLPKEVVRYMIAGVVDEAVKRAKRNFRLAIPQYYQGKIGYFLPIEFPVNDDKYVTMALAVENVNGVYRANTIYTLEDAYSKARLLMQIDTNWLLK